MSELGRGGVNVIGFSPDKHDAIRSEITSRRLDERARTLERLRPATLTPEQRMQATSVEQATRDYLVGKLRRLGLPDDSLLAIPQVHYTIQERKKGDRQRAGDFDPVTNITQVFDHRKSYDFFDMLSTIPHESSHATVNREAEYNFEDGAGPSVHSTGLEFIENHTLQGSGIEEAMVIFDEVDFFHSRLREMFPDEYNKRRALTTPGQLKEYGKIDQSLYGSFNPDHILPFVALYKPLPIGPVKIPIIKEAIKEYLFIRKLCEMVGRHTSPTITDPEEAVRVGRDILDKDRYLRIGEARRQIIETLGEDNASKIFQLGAHDGNIDTAMRVLVTAKK